MSKQCKQKQKGVQTRTFKGSCIYHKGCTKSKPFCSVFDVAIANDDDVGFWQKKDIFLMVKRSVEEEVSQFVKGSKEKNNEKYLEFETNKTIRKNSIIFSYYCLFFT